MIDVIVFIDLQRFTILVCWIEVVRHGLSKKLAINSSRCSMMNERGCSYSCEPLGIYV